MTITCPSHVQLQVLLRGQVLLQTASGEGPAIRTLKPFHGEHTTDEDALEFRVTWKEQGKVGTTLRNS